MKTTISIVFVCLSSVALPLLAQGPNWTKTLKPRDKPSALQNRTQYVRGDSGKWNDNARLQHAPPIPPVKISLDDWADRLLKKKNVEVTERDDNWLIFRTKQIDDNDRVWVERIERRGNKITVIANKAKWKGKYFRNFTYYQVIGVNLGKLAPGKYEAKWILKPMAFLRFDGDGRPRGNWPKDLRAVKSKPAELRVTFDVGKSSP